LKISYDVGNARAAGRDVAAEIKLLGDSICLVRLKDRERREPFTAMPLGQGLVDWKAVFTALAEIHYDRWLVLDTPSGDDPIASAQQNLAFVRRYLA
jgi:inosose dehydratase